MPILKINGMEIPIFADSEAEITETIIGERKSAFNGTLLTSINNWRKTLVLNTPWLEKQDADAIVGIVQGLGNNWKLNGHLYSGKGVQLDFERASTRYTTDGISVDSGDAGYGPSLYLNTLSTDMKSLWIEERTENLLRENQATASSSSGFETISSGEITFTTSGDPWEGDQCMYMEVTSSGLWHGMRVNNGVQDGGDYTFSVYAKGESGSVGNVFLSIYDGVTITDSDTFVLTEDWARYDVTSNCTSGTIYGYFRNSDTGLVACYLDGLQLE
jgi:hypothetical protein